MAIDPIPEGWAVVDGNWYGRTLTHGPVHLRLEIWRAKEGEWVVCVNGGPTLTVRQPSAFRAMLAADIIVAGHLRAAARVLKGG